MPDKPEVTLHGVDKRLNTVESRLTMAPWIAMIVLGALGYYVESATDQSHEIKQMLKDHDDEAHAAREKLEERIDELDKELKQSWMDQLKKHWNDRTDQ